VRGRARRGRYGRVIVYYCNGGGRWVCLSGINFDHVCLYPTERKVESERARYCSIAISSLSILYTYPHTMRHKRAKTYKRAISIYTTAFGFRQPFQVLGESVE